MTGNHGNAMRRVQAARRIGVVAGAVAVAGSTLVASSARAHPGPPGYGITVVDARTGTALPADPLLHRGQRVVVTVPRFASRAHVVVALVGVRTLAHLRADRAGVVGYPFTVPARIRRGQHSLVFSGPARGTEPRPARGGTRRPRRDPQAVQVAVPYDPPWPFRVGRAATGGSGGQHGPPGHGGGASTTGTNVLFLVLLGSVAVLGGAGALAAGRRRRAILPRDGE